MPLTYHRQRIALHHRQRIALHCGKAHVQSQWERANFDAQSKDIKLPEIFQI